MRPVPLYLLTRISDDIERAIAAVERAQRQMPSDGYRPAGEAAQAAWDVLNEMRNYVNDAAEPMDLADPRQN